MAVIHVRYHGLATTCQGLSGINLDAQCLGDAGQIASLCYNSSWNGYMCSSDRAAVTKLKIVITGSHRVLKIFTMCEPGKAPQPSQL